jgi:hypothetical protein
LLWHFAQVCGRLSLNTGESSCLTGTISWAPWQLTQVAAPEAPIAWLIPWMLGVGVASFAWQVAHWAGGSLSSCGHVGDRDMAIDAEKLAVDRVHQHPCFAAGGRRII